jgi:hypothetical protein
VFERLTSVRCALQTGDYSVSGLDLHVQGQEEPAFVVIEATLKGKFVYFVGPFCVGISGTGPFLKGRKRA